MILQLVLILTAELSFGHGTMHEQISHLTHEIKKHPKQAELYLKRGEVYRNHEEWTSAGADFKAARAIDPKQPGLDLAESRLNYDRGMFGEALNFVDRHLSGQEDEHARLLRARILVGNKQWAEAVKDFTNYIDHSKSPQPQPFVDRALAQMAIGQSVQAIAGLDEGIQKLGAIISLQEEALKIEVAAKFYDRALVRLDTIMKGLNRKEQWLAKKAGILQLAGRKNEAVKAYEQTLAEIDSLPEQYRNTIAIRKLKAEVESKIH